MLFDGKPTRLALQAAVNNQASRAELQAELEDDLKRDADKLMQRTLWILEDED